MIYVTTYIMDYNLNGVGYSRMTVGELKEYLRGHGCKISGCRRELIERLVHLKIPPPEYRTERYRIYPGVCIHNTDCDEYVSSTCNLRLYNNLLGPKMSMGIYQHILDHIVIPPIIKKRFNRTYGDEGLVYTIEFGGYGGKPGKTVERVALPWSDIPHLKKLKRIVERVTNSVYTYCVVQYYPCGKVGIKPHRDKEMTPGSVIAGLSVGQSRTLRMSRRGENLDLEIPSGSLYVFYPPTNDYWSHSILTDESTHPRISLTFRTLI